jgi:hypothetical protein
MPFSGAPELMEEGYRYPIVPGDEPTKGSAAMPRPDLATCERASLPPLNARRRDSTRAFLNPRYLFGHPVAAADVCVKNCVLIRKRVLKNALTARKTRFHAMGV